MSYAEITVAHLEDNGSASIQTGPFGTQLKASDYTDEGVPVINVRKHRVRRPSSREARICARLDGGTPQRSCSRGE